MIGVLGHVYRLYVALTNAHFAEIQKMFGVLLHVGQPDAKDYIDFYQNTSGVILFGFSCPHTCRIHCGRSRLPQSLDASRFMKDLSLRNDCYQMIIKQVNYMI